MRRPVKDRPNAYEELVSWIPLGIARLGNVVRLKEWPNDKEWSEGWEVIAVGARRPGDLIEAGAADYKKQRGESDAFRDKEGSWDTPNRRRKKESA